MLACPDCGGRLRLVATIADSRVIAKDPCPPRGCRWNRRAPRPRRRGGPSRQAVKHIAAEMVSEIEPARALVWYAAYAADGLPREAPRAARRLAGSSAWAPPAARGEVAALLDREASG